MYTLHILVFALDICNDTCMSDPSSCEHSPLLADSALYPLPVQSYVTEPPPLELDVSAQNGGIRIQGDPGPLRPEILTSIANALVEIRRNGTLLDKPAFGFLVNRGDRPPLVVTTAENVRYAKELYVIGNGGALVTGGLVLLQRRGERYSGEVSLPSECNVAVLTLAEGMEDEGLTLAETGDGEELTTASPTEPGDWLHMVGNTGGLTVHRGFVKGPGGTIGSMPGHDMLVVPHAPDVMGNDPISKLTEVSGAPVITRDGSVTGMASRVYGPHGARFFSSSSKKNNGWELGLNTRIIDTRRDQPCGLNVPANVVGMQRAPVLWHVIRQLDGQ